MISLKRYNINYKSASVIDKSSSIAIYIHKSGNRLDDSLREIYRYCSKSI